jgi:hypothetical protein
MRSALTLLGKCLRSEPLCGLSAANCIHSFVLAVAPPICSSKLRACVGAEFRREAVVGESLGLGVRVVLGPHNPSFKRTAPMLGPSFISSSGVWHRAAA